MAITYTFRVDEVEGVTRQSVIDFLASLSCQHVVCYEISDVTKKPHYQGWVHLDLSQQVWQNRIKRQWPSVCSTKRGRTSGHYSAAPVRKDSYKSYVLKGTRESLPDVVSSQLPPYETLDVENVHRAWWSQQASTSSSKKVHIVEEGIEVFRSHNWICGEYDMYAKRNEVAAWVIGKFEGKGVNSFLVKNYVNGILCVTSGDYKTQFIQQIANSERW